jgi:hypothetical protein
LKTHEYDVSSLLASWKTYSRLQRPPIRFYQSVVSMESSVRGPRGNYWVYTLNFAENLCGWNLVDLSLVGGGYIRYRPLCFEDVPGAILGRFFIALGTEELGGEDNGFWGATLGILSMARSLATTWLAVEGIFPQATLSDTKITIHPVTQEYWCKVRSLIPCPDDKIKSSGLDCVTIDISNLRGIALGAFLQLIGQ